MHPINMRAGLGNKSSNPQFEVLGLLGVGSRNPCDARGDYSGFAYARGAKLPIVQMDLKCSHVFLPNDQRHSAAAK